MRPAPLLVGLLLAACSGGAHPAASISPTPVSRSTPTPVSPTATPDATCTGQIPAGHNLVLGVVNGSTAVVLRDITNPTAAQTLCTFAESTIQPRFVTATAVSWAEGATASGPDQFENSPGSIVKLDLTNNAESTIFSWPQRQWKMGEFDWSPDGKAVTYTGGSTPGVEWFLNGKNQADIFLGFPRAVDPVNDDFFLRYSPDGNYAALVTTFTGPRTPGAPAEIRNTSDGSLVYSADSGTMAVWASWPSRLYFRDVAGNVSRWDPSTGVSQVQSGLQWVRPRSSPDGLWIAYTIFDSSNLPHVGLFTTQANQAKQLPGVRSDPVFLSGDLVWYHDPQGNPFIYDIAAGTETPSRLTRVFDAWPRVTPPG